ncbi:MAG: hypothetical protein RIQ39_663 [Actinomycetota bacterium]|jgi:uncharacterized protein (UPF0303 family)
METTGGFTSVQLLEHEAASAFDYLDTLTAIEIGTSAIALGRERNFPITIAIELDGAEVFRETISGDAEEHANWMARKSRVVNLTHHSTMYERVKAEEDEIDWHAKHGVVDETHAIHGGGFPLITVAGDFRGVLLVSGLPQVEDHLFAFEVLSNNK